MPTVRLPSYAIQLEDITRSLPAFLHEQAFSSLFVIVDRHTARDCLPRVSPLLEEYAWETVEIPAGEQHKTLDTCRLIWDHMMRARLDRQALVLNLGGGVIGDMGGFCAATFKRGLRFAQLPTTVLAQVDASIGGKLGIDFGSVKNSIGLFRDPEAVFIDTGFLRTLPRREQRSGLAEIIKHSLIAEADQWRQLSTLQRVEAADWPALIGPSLRVKERIVRADPLERGQRKSLNFGHTIGHGVEAAALDGPDPLLHGEAIAVGMIAEAWLSHRWLGLPEKALQQIQEVILRLFGHRPIRSEQLPEVLQLMRNDKKNTARGINFSLLPAIGSCQVDCYGPEADIREALRHYNRLA